MNCTALSILPRAVLFCPTNLSSAVVIIICALFLANASAFAIISPYSFCASCSIFFVFSAISALAWVLAALALALLSSIMLSAFFFGGFYRIYDFLDQLLLSSLFCSEQPVARISQTGNDISVIVKAFIHRGDIYIHIGMLLHYDIYTIWCGYKID